MRSLHRPINTSLRTKLPYLIPGVIIGLSGFVATTQGQTRDSDRLTITIPLCPHGGPRYAKALRAFNGGDFSKAKKYLEKLQAQKPNLPEVAQALAVVSHELGDLEGAVRMAGKALRWKPLDPLMLQLKYESLKELGIEDELPLLRTLLLQVHNGNYKAVIYHDQGIEAEKAGDLTEALKLYLKAEQHDPSLPAIQERLAYTYFDLKDHTKAVEYAAKVRLRRPSDLGFLQVFYESSMALGQEQSAREALREFEAEVAVTDSAAFFYHEAKKAAVARHVGWAEELFLLAMEKGYSPFKVRKQMAFLFFNNKRYARAAKEAEELLRINPNHEEALHLRYESYDELGDEEGRRAALEERINRDPCEATSNLIYNEGVLELEQGNLDSAEKRFLEALEMHSHNSHALAGLAEVRLKKGQYCEAKGIAEVALENDRSHKAALEVLELTIQAIEDSALVCDSVAGR